MTEIGYFLSSEEHDGRSLVATAAHAVATVKVCWGEDEANCRRMAHQLWRSSGVPGELSQVLPTSAHFEQATELVTEDQVAAKIACGPDPERHLEGIQTYLYRKELQPLLS